LVIEATLETGSSKPEVIMTTLKKSGLVQWRWVRRISIKWTNIIRVSAYERDTGVYQQSEVVISDGGQDIFFSEFDRNSRQLEDALEYQLGPFGDNWRQRWRALTGDETLVLLSSSMD
jgi:hypothetical protein